MTRFLSYCSSGFVEGLGEQLRWIHDRQFWLTWHEYVGMQVTGRDPDMRERRALIAEVLLLREPVAKRDIPRLTPELAQIYAASGPQTLARDLNEFASIGFLRTVNGRYQADGEVLMSLLPLTVSPAGTPSSYRNHHHTAVDWVNAAGGDWANCAALTTTNTDHT